MQDSVNLRIPPRLLEVGVSCLELMKYSNFLTVFFIVAISYTFITFLNTDISSKAYYENNRYSTFLNSATQSAMNTAISNSASSYIFETEYQRQDTVASFYDTLVSCFNYNGTVMRDRVYYYVPCVVLIDVNGFYIEYTETYKDSYGIDTFKEIITPINKWGKVYTASNIYGTRYYIEYNLNDTVRCTVQDSSNKNVTIEGHYSKVWDELGRPEILKPVFETPSKFKEEKNEIIIHTITDQMQYYINKHDEFYNQKNDAQYHFTLPMVTDEDWARLIDQPTIFAFLQGVQTEYYNRYINIYALTASEITEALTYVIQQDATDNCSYYHNPNCHLLTSGDRKVYSMEEAARKGAYPCIECVR